MSTPEEIAAAEAAAAEAAAAEAAAAEAAAAEEAKRLAAEEQAARTAADNTKPNAGGKASKKEKAASTPARAVKANPVLALAEKGGQFLTRHVSGVWSYPGCPRDPSATHLVYPQESVTDDAVREAILDGHVAVTLIDIHGQAVAVRVLEEGEEPPRAVSALHAGSLDAATLSRA